MSGGEERADHPREAPSDTNVGISKHKARTFVTMTGPTWQHVCSARHELVLSAKMRERMQRRRDLSSCLDGVLLKSPLLLLSLDLLIIASSCRDVGCDPRIR